jgi:hypothetical protein
MPKVSITLSEDMWEWWQANKWINLSQLAERELRRLRTLEERNLGNCPSCGNEKLKFVDGKRYKCTRCGFLY